MADKPPHVLIIGCGISGMSAALALSTFSTPPPRITLCEARASLPALGGAINITPNGQRYLSAFGALDAVRSSDAGADVRSIDLFNCATGAAMGNIAFAHPDGRGMGDPAFHAVRIRRVDLLRGMLARVEALGNARVLFGKKLAAVNNSAGGVKAVFEDGSSEEADLLLGCDGIHSAVRGALQPDRQPQYTGVAIVNGYTAGVDDGVWRPENDTAFLWTPQGSFFSSFYEQTRSKLYVVGLWERQEVASREGWQAKGRDQVALLEELRRRFGTGAFQGVGKLVDSVDEWSLYPVYNLPPRGIWSQGRTMLLGDAAHAMSPQGESATIAMEDSVIFGRLFAGRGDRSLLDVFAAFERNRRERVEAAYKEADYRWRTNKDMGWVGGKLMEWFTPSFLWMTAGKRQRVWEEDLTQADLEW